MKVVIKGLNYTEMWFRNKKTRIETVHFAMIAKERKSTDCGVWMDGKQVLDYDSMLDKGFFVRRTAEERLTDLKLKKESP